MDARGPLEARVLGVERGLEAMDRDLRNLRRQVLSLSQGVWAAWSEVHARITTPSLQPPTPSFPAICRLFPPRLPILDSLYGGSFLSWDGVSKWTGCRAVAVPAGGSCGAVASSAIRYSLQGDNTTATWVLTVSYDSTGTPNFCPVNGATCGTATNRSDTMSATISCCAPYQFNYSHGSTVSPIWANQDINLVITPFVGNLTPASTIPFTSSGTFYSGVSGTLTWDGVSAWTACVAGISFVGSGSCLAVTMAATFKLDQYGKFTMTWLITNATNCPASSNCASTPSAGQTMHTGQCFYNSDSCPSSVTYKLTSTFGTSPEARLGTPTVTLTL